MNNYFTFFQSPDNLVLFLASVAIVVSIIYWHFDKKTIFDVRDLLIDKTTQRLSLYKIGQFFALMVSTWALIHETRYGRLTEWLFGAYMVAWSGANLANKYLDKFKEVIAPKEPPAP